jgi:hypothetical protein
MAVHIVDPLRHLEDFQLSLVHAADVICAELFRSLDFRDPFKHVPILLPPVLAVATTAADAIEDRRHHGVRQHYEDIRTRSRIRTKSSLSCVVGRERTETGISGASSNPTIERHGGIVIGIGMTDHGKTNALELHSVISGFETRDDLLVIHRRQSTQMKLRSAHSRVSSRRARPP